MKREVYSYPKSSFLSMEKDLRMIVDMVMKNERLKKLLYYTDKKALQKPNIGEDAMIEMFGKQIKIIPKLTVDSDELNYLVITFNNFAPNGSNPEFRDNVIEFDIVCHFSQWQLEDFQLRPYKIAAELDAMFNDKRLTGIGKVDFIGADRLILNDEFAGICLMYQAIHGEEDKKNALTELEQADIEANFDAMFNPHRVNG